MKTVQTVLGPVSTEEMGSVLMHEHLVASSMGVANNYRCLYKKGYKEQILSDLKDMKDNGISTLLEATPACLGRDVRVLKEVAEESGMNIIASSGWWGCEPPYVGPTTAEAWAEAFIGDLTVGCDGTDIKAGALKAAMDYHVTEWSKKIHRAVGMAHLETGAKIYLHTYCPTETPRKQLAILKEVGVDLKNVAVDHIPETTDLDFVKWIYDQGAWLGIDRLPCMTMPGDNGSVPIERRIKFIKEILDAGMGDRVLFSHDFMSVSGLHDHQSPEVIKILQEQNPYRFLFLKNYVFRELEKMGVDYDYLWNLTIENPKKFFEA